MHPQTTTPPSPQTEQRFAWLMPANAMAFAAIALPWLNPFTWGPSVSHVQLLFTWLCAGIWLLSVAYGRRRDWVAGVAWAWVVAASVSAALCLLQYLGYANKLFPWVNVTAVGEAFGNLRQRNQCATLLSIGLAALFYLTATQQKRGAAVHTASPATLWGTTGTNTSGNSRGTIRNTTRNTIWATTWQLACATLLGAGLAATGSRTGTLQLVCLSLILLVGCASRRMWPQRALGGSMLFAVVGYAAAAVVLPWLLGHAAHEFGILARLHDRTITCESRVNLWSNVAYLIEQRPWTGWGWGELGYAHFVTLFPSERFCSLLDNAHDLPLQLAVELGLPLTLGLLALGGYAIWRAKPWRERHPARLLAWAVLLVIGIHSALEYPLWYAPFQVAAGIALLVLWRTPKLLAATQSAPPPDSAALTKPLAIAGMLVVCVSSLVAWDYWRISQLYLSANQRHPDYREDTLAKVRDSWVFRNQVRFAELSALTLSAQNASYYHELAKDMLHLSAEPRVVEAVIRSAMLLGKRDEVAYYSQRYRAAFGRDFGG